MSEILFPDIGQCSLIKHSESICGDFYYVLRDGDRMTAVLSDGLGSGVKANILATLTSKILSTLIARDLPLDECIYTVASTLPMCSERKIAYATFTVLQIEGNTAYLVQYDNPSAILLRCGESVQYKKDVHFYAEKQIYESRFELQDGDMILLMRHEKKMYTTIPLGIILKSEAIITVCKIDTPIINYFVRNKVKEFSTKKKMRFIYQMLFRSAFVYQANLRLIDKKRIEIEERVDGDTSDTDLIELHELESTLVYFATSLRANSIVLERLRRYKRLEQYPEDMELLEDVMVEYQQAIEMTTIYRDVIDGTRELMSSVIDSKLNNVMKYLTSITIVMAIPTIISGIYGMNVGEEWMPFAKTPFGFEIISGVMLIICIIVLWVLRKKKML